MEVPKFVLAIFYGNAANVVTLRKKQADFQLPAAGRRLIRFELAFTALETEAVAVRLWETAGVKLGRSGSASLVILAAVTPSPVLELFLKTGAYLQGHFRLTSGLHSGEYLQCAKVLAFPEYAEWFGRELAKKLPVSGVQVVVSPAIGGIVIGHEVARALQVRSLFAERDGATKEMTLRRGFEIKPGERAVVIEDVITTGGSTKEVIRLLRDLGAEVLAAGSIIDRSGGAADVEVPRVALETLNAVTYKPDICPLCRENVPLVKPGSRPT